MGTGYERPGRGVYVTATAALEHGNIAVVRNYVGSVIKQLQPSRDTPKAERTVVAIGERIFLRTKGIAEAQTGAGQQGNALAAAVVGDPVYIVAATGVLTATATGNVKVGRVHAVPGVHGCPPGIIRIDMDVKDGL
jgi:hypothetical protein